MASGPTVWTYVVLWPVVGLLLLCSGVLTVLAATVLRGFGQVISAITSKRR